jgi:tRNA (cytidine/uridine-2'-O-)-methyltransferase
MSFHVVLVEPEIPQNTGSIGRLCLATNCTLHLIEPLGFEITHSRLKRAGLDYWQHLDVKQYASLGVFLEQIPADAPKWLFSAKAKKSLFEVKMPLGSYLFFGKETKGLPLDFTSAHSENLVQIPLLSSKVRSLNLANAVSIAVYEALRSAVFAL